MEDLEPRRLADPRLARRRSPFEKVREDRRQPLRAEKAHLLVGGEEKYQRARQASAIEPRGGIQALRDEHLHVGSSATVDAPAFELEPERVALPAGLTLEGHGVDVSGDD